MSIERARELLDRISSDVVLRQKLENTESIEERKKILAEYGFAGISREDVEAAGHERGEELTDAELEAVSGGRTSTWIGISVTIVAAAALA